MDQLRPYVFRNPGVVYGVTSSTLGFIALTPTPSLVSLCLLLSTLYVQADALFPRRAVAHAIIQPLLLAFAASAAHLGPSLTALSTPLISITVLTTFTLISSLTALVIFGATFLCRRLVLTPCAQITLFPALWASVWGAEAYFSPVGRLLTWSPLIGLGPYEWIRPVFGQYGIDWITAAWAVVGSHILGQWLMGDGVEREDDMLLVPEGNTRSTSRSRTRSVSYFAGFLILLMAPSYIQDRFPASRFSPDVTPLSVACALPFPHKSDHRIRAPTLDDYIGETIGLQNAANVILWPEGAVRFQTSAERAATINRLRKELPKKKLYGIAFEEFVLAQPPNDRSSAGHWMNGLVLLSDEGTVMEYYKRKLVPIAESFSITPATDPPEIYTMELHHPRDWTGPEWAPPLQNGTRPIPVTASICLDSASSSAFDGLPSRPALILAPARTWHIDVGYAMWEQAKARAEETGSMVLWCDGGEGGVSGIAGGGMNGFEQVGQGSWAKTIGVQWPFDQRRTFFSFGGDGAALAVLWAIVGLAWAAEVAVPRLVESRDQAGTEWSVRSLLHNARAAIVRIRNKPEEERPLLE